MSGSMTGLKELNDALERVNKGASEAGRTAVRRVARRMTSTMQATVPVDSGNLKGTIAMVEDSQDKVAVLVGDESTYYLGFVEFGTSKMDAQPFVRPAVAQAENELLTVALEESLRRVK